LHLSQTDGAHSAILYYRAYMWVVIREQQRFLSLSWVSLPALVAKLLRAGLDIYTGENRCHFFASLPFVDHAHSSFGSAAFSSSSSKRGISFYA
jgi:hypothetical protein